MVSRREFLIKSTVASGSLLMPNLTYSKSGFNSQLQNLKTKRLNESINDLIDDKAYWKMVRRLFNPQQKFINLENGYFSAQPESTLAAQFENISTINSKNSFYMRKTAVNELKRVKEEMALFSGLNESEFTICRNTTEALDTIVHGYPWQRGDEVVVNHQDYYSMLAAFEQQSKRSGIKTIYTKIPLKPKSDQEIVSAYERAITPKTKMILVTHVINLTGQVLPVKKITEMAHSKGIEVMVDGAHSFAHLPFQIKDLNADYFGCSLHKWLCCPIGLGLMHIKKKHIEKIWPLFGDNEFAKNDIRKFEHFGTRPNSATTTILSAIDFHNSIGQNLKYERLFFLKNYWTTQANEIKNVTINTPFDKDRSCALANVSVKGLTPGKLAEKLYDEYNIFTVAIESEDVNGVRITPHLYTSTNELDQLINALKSIAA